VGLSRERTDANASDMNASDGVDVGRKQMNIGEQGDGCRERHECTATVGRTTFSAWIPLQRTKFRDVKRFFADAYPNPNYYPNPFH
jgi:hypothetical protein